MSATAGYKLSLLKAGFRSPLKEAKADDPESVLRAGVPSPD